MKDIKLPAIMEVENSIGAWIKRVVVHINPNNSCVAIKGDPLEKRVKTISVFAESFSNFRNCREIKEPTWRAYNEDEDVQHLVGKILKNKLGDTYIVTSSFPNDKQCIGIMEESYDRNDLWYSFKIEINGKWQPVGVLEQ